LRQKQRIIICSTLVLFLFWMACNTDIRSSANLTGKEELMPSKDINLVLNDHDKELMAIPGVVGVYVGLLSEDETPCLKVIVVKETDDLVKRIPKYIEGYPVVIEKSEPIHPMQDPL
jgi:hypothetical protein